MVLSGNGLVSYYINLVLEGVGVTRTETKAAINGGLQVPSLPASTCGPFLKSSLDFQFLHRCISCYADRLGRPALTVHRVKCWYARR